MLRRSAVQGSLLRVMLAPLCAAASSVVSAVSLAPSIALGHGLPPATDGVAAPSSGRVVSPAVDDEGMEIPWKVHVGQAGVPKHKKGLKFKTRASQGIHFKHKYLRYQAWYFCPLCAEPKQQGTCCRREDCRQLKP
jgi:hypothetical protein